MSLKTARQATGEVVHGRGTHLRWDSYSLCREESTWPEEKQVAWRSQRRRANKGGFDVVASHSLVALSHERHRRVRRWPSEFRTDRDRIVNA